MRGLSVSMKTPCPFAQAQRDIVFDLSAQSAQRSNQQGSRSLAVYIEVAPDEDTLPALNCLQQIGRRLADAGQFLW